MAQPKITAFFRSPKAPTTEGRKGDHEDAEQDGPEEAKAMPIGAANHENQVQPMILVDDDHRVNNDGDDDDVIIVAHNSSFLEAKAKVKPRRTSFFKRTPKRKRPPLQQDEDNDLQRMEDGIIGMKVRSPTNERQQQQATSAGT